MNLTAWTTYSGHTNALDKNTEVFFKYIDDKNNCIITDRKF